MADAPAIAAAATNPDAKPKMMTSIRETANGGVEIINQLLLPHIIQWDSVSTIEDAFDAIKSMKIRGAPAIASLAALTIALVIRESLTADQPTSTSNTRYPVPDLSGPSSLADFQQWLTTIVDYLESSRPTAVNLSEAMNRIRRSSSSFTSSSDSDSNSNPAKTLANQILSVCAAVHTEDLARNKKMSQIAGDWLWEKRRAGQNKQEGRKLKVMTVCNTGSLATSGYGTALGVITYLHETDLLEKAFYTQSTPYHQGSRLTSLELSTLQIPACMICDTMVGSLFQHQDIDAVIVGADRVVANGDTANKIGTYQAAVLAKRHGIPFMVIAPCTTLDLSIPTGKGIHIEQRPSIEATLVRGLVVNGHGEQAVVQVTPNGIGSGGNAWQDVYNPSFDVTPSDLISCVVTERGVAENATGSATSIDVARVA